MAFNVGDVRAALKSLDTLRYGAGDLQEALRRIVSTTHDLFSVDGAALMLIDGELALRNAAVSDCRLEQLESLQITHGTGPVSRRFRTELISCEDLVGEDRWGDFSAEAVAAGLRAVLVSPIPYASDAIGVVAVFSAKPHPWTPEGGLALMSFTDLAALAIATIMQSEERGELAGQLQGALDARVVVEQAKGILIGRDGLDPRDALERLRAQARADPPASIGCGVRSGQGRHVQRLIRRD